MHLFPGIGLGFYIVLSRADGVQGVGSKIGALIIRIGFWGPIIYYSYNKEPPKIVEVIFKAPILGFGLMVQAFRLPV